MREFFLNLNNYIEMFLRALGIWGPILGCILIMVESILPVLPLFIFITLNFLSFGPLTGFIISWLFTIIGCYTSFWLCQRGIKGWFDKNVRKKRIVNKFMKIIDNLKFSYLVLLVAIPLTPAFALNIAAGLSKINYKKYLYSLIIGKIFLVYFWGFVGTSLIESFTNPKALIKVAISLLIAYILSLIINKKVHIEGE